MDQGVVDQIGHRPLEQHRVGADTGERGWDLDGDLGATRPQALDSVGDQLIDIGGLMEHIHRAGLQPAHVEQVLDQGAQPVRFVVNGLEEDASLLGPEGELVREEARGGRFDGRQWRPEVVAHCGQQRGPELICPGQGVRSGSFGMEPVALEHRRQLGGEGGQDVPVLGGEPRAPEDQDLPVGERKDHGGFLGGQGWSWAGGHHGRPRSRGDLVPSGSGGGGGVLGAGAQHGGRFEAEGDQEFLEECRQGVAFGGDHPPGHPGQHPSVGPGLDGGGALSGRDIHQHADHSGRDQKHDQRRHVPRIGDGEGMDGWCEVVVGEEEAGQRRQHRRPYPAGGRHHDDQHQVAAQGGGQVNVGAAGDQYQGEQREPDDADSKCGEPPANRKWGEQAAPVAFGPVAVRFGAAVMPEPTLCLVGLSVNIGVGADDMDVERAAGHPDDRVDHRATEELGQPVAMGGP